jgi:hypothetical protein
MLMRGMMVGALALTLLLSESSQVTAADRELWKHSEGYFVKLKGDRWQERGSKDDGKFNYVETRRNEEFVELHDRSRGVMVRLRKGVAMFKDDKSEKFSKLYDGEWKD